MGPFFFKSEVKHIDNMGWSASPMQWKSSCHSNRKGGIAAKWQMRPNSILVSEWPTPNFHKGFLNQFSCRTMWDSALLMVKARIWGVSSVFPALQLLPWESGEAATATPGLTPHCVPRGLPPCHPQARSQLRQQNMMPASPETCSWLICGHRKPSPATAFAF